MMGIRSIDDLEDAGLGPALQAYTQGKPFVFRGTGYVPTKAGLELRASTDKQPWEVTRDDASTIKNRAETDMRELYACYPEFTKDLGVPVRVIVEYDYGMGGVEISRFDADGVTWLLRDK